MTNIFTVSIILFKVQTTNDYSTKALKKRSMHKFVLTERVPGETATGPSGLQAERYLRIEMQKVASEPDS